MSEPIVTAMDRFTAVISDPMTIEVLGQRVMEGESLKKIAQSWEVPVMRFIEWVVNDLGRLQVYQAALKVRADQMVSETIEIADDDQGDARRDALRVKTRLQVAGHYDRERFGAVTRQSIDVTHRKSGAEWTDAELQALLDRAVADARALEGESTEVLARARLPARLPPPPLKSTDPAEDLTI